jgi:hypothetical protein
MAQLLVVFDDAVMHYCNTATGIAAVWPNGKMRVGVRRRGRAMRCPTGMSYAGVSLQAQRLNFKFGNPRDAANAAQLAIEINGDAAGIVAAVFKATQAFDQEWNDVASRNGTDDSAHDEYPENRMRQMLCA